MREKKRKKIKEKENRGKARIESRHRERAAPCLRFKEAIVGLVRLLLFPVSRAHRSPHRSPQQNSPLPAAALASPPFKFWWVFFFFFSTHLTRLPGVNLKFCSAKGPHRGWREEVGGAPLLIGEAASPLLLLPRSLLFIHAHTHTRAHP